LGLEQKVHLNDIKLKKYKQRIKALESEPIRAGGLQTNTTHH